MVHQHYCPNSGVIKAFDTICQKIKSIYKQQSQTLDLKSLIYPEKFKRIEDLQERLLLTTDKSIKEILKKEMISIDEELVKTKISRNARFSNLTQQIIKEVEVLGYGLELDEKTKEILFYDGVVWNQISEKSLVKFIYDLLDSYHIQIKNGFEDEICKAKFIRQFYWDLPDFQEKKFDDFSVINFLNGTFELGLDQESSKFREHRKEDKLRMVLPYNYNPKATISYFDKTLELFIPEIDKQRLLFEFLGYIFHRNRDLFNLECMLIMYGKEGRNGKSTIDKVCKSLFGKSNTMAASLSQLCSPNSYYAHHLRNKWLNICSETSAKDIDQEFMRALISGENVWVRPIRSDPFEMSDYAKLMFILNNLPDFEPDMATQRRIMTIVFDKTISAKEADTSFHKKIIENDLPGIFNKAIEHFWKLVERNEFASPESSISEMEGWRRDVCTVTDFVKSNRYNNKIKKEVSNFYPTNDLFELYKNWCSENQVEAKKFKQGFSKAFKNNGFKSDTVKNKRGYYVGNIDGRIFKMGDNYKTPF